MNKVVGNVVSSLTGNPNKGYLLIKKPNSGAPKPDATNQPTSNSGDGLSGAKAALDKSSLVRTKSKAFSKAEGAEDYISIQVQYNPSSIYIATMKGEILNRSAGGDGENAFQQWNVPVRTTLNVDLFFDDMNIRDAFNFENIVSIAGVRDAAKQMINSDREKEYSVRPLVEALIGALGDKNTRKVIFVWNSMAFEGEMVNVGAEYMMFNGKGEPIRAKVSIQIYQDNGNEKEKENLTYWKNAYEKLFASDYAGGGKNTFQHMNPMSNLINL